VELWGADGESVRMVVSGVGAVELVELARAFWRRGP